MPCASITSKANCLETMRVEWHSYQKPLRRCGRVRRQQQFDYYCKAPNPLQSISQIIENVFFVLASLFLVQWICAPLPTHSAAQHSTESLLPNSEGTKRRCKSRYCTDFVTWILKRQIFYVTKISIWCVCRGTISPAARIGTMCTNERFPVLAFLDVLVSCTRYGIYVSIAFIYSTRQPPRSTQWVAQHFLLGDSWLAPHTDSTSFQLIGNDSGDGKMGLNVLD